jgi:putative nucleotidyltransferase with HDIG domain
MPTHLIGDPLTAFYPAESLPASPEQISATQHLVESLRKWFGIDFAIVDIDTGDVVRCPAELACCNWELWGQMCRSMAHNDRAEVLVDEEPFYVLAIPAIDERESRWIAAGVFTAKSADKHLPALMRMFGCGVSEAREWAQQNNPLSVDLALRLAERFQDACAAEQRIRQLEREVEDLSLNLSSTYEEISLIYRLTQNLKLSSRDDELGRLALGWLSDVIPAEALAIQFTAIADASAVDVETRTEPTLLMRGACPLNCEQFTRLLQRLGPLAPHHPLILHGEALSAFGDVALGVRELLIVPLCEGQNIFGYLAAFNHVEEREFGTVEASLLSSVAAILGIHSGNIELYRQQREFLRGVVRALTSAIDAKDPYTCGHSDRVARVAVRLAEELGCDNETLNTIYLSGLLHDIGKIGIDDNVLRKPGKLTDIEYEHIKLHSEIGFRILKDLRQLDEVLPVVLHHHEQWDGRGYPHNLAGDSIPFMARIVAVADAFDAMGSDRPYRQGMPEARLDQVLREGAGKQWDPTVIEAFFRARNEIRGIFRNDRQPHREISQWI